MNGTSWLLGGGYPWLSVPATAATSNVVASAEEGVSLAPLPKGPAALDSENADLGGLTLPIGVAVDGVDLYILSRDGSLIYRYDPVKVTLAPISHLGWPGEAADAQSPLDERAFREATNIAAFGGGLYVLIRSQQRVQVFDLKNLALIRVHRGFGDPADITAGQRGVYILDSAGGTVYRASPHRDNLTVVAHLPAKANRWDRIALDGEERIYLRDSVSQPPSLDLIEAAGAGQTKIQERFTAAAQVKSRFSPLGLEDDGFGGFKLSDVLADPCGLRRPQGPLAKIWQFESRLYVADRETRQIRVHLEDGRLIHRFGPYDGAGRSVTAQAKEAWSPADLAWFAGCTVILDQSHRVVHAHQPGAAVLRRWFQAPLDHSSQWRRIAADDQGCLLLWDGSSSTVDRVDSRGRLQGTAELRAVRNHFEAGAARQKTPGPTGIPPRLTRAGAIPVTRTSHFAPPRQRYQRAGLWVSSWLDSEIYNCQWHVLELSISKLPPGSRLVVKTRTSNTAPRPEDTSVVQGVESLGSWTEIPAILGLDQPSEKDLAGLDRLELLVLSGPGQFIQVLLELSGDGIRSPLLTSLRLRFPRESYLQYLPAIYSAPEEQREFLDRFLSVLHTTWGALERDVESFERYFDPASVPGGQAMRYLASWLALRLEGTWTDEQNRKLLAAMPGLLATWGTPAGMRAWIRVYLSNLSGVEPETLESSNLPGLVESFVERRRLMLARGDTATLGSAEGLWSPSVERRLQVGVFDREGEVELVSVGDPELDIFRHYAHRFRVFVPSAWVRTPAHEALIRRAIGAQKPAHTTYDLVLVEPRFRIGVQSTVELDTIIGTPLPTQLAYPAEETPASQPPRRRLGFDTVLGCGSDGAALGSSDLILA